MQIPSRVGFVRFCISVFILRLTSGDRGEKGVHKVALELDSHAGSAVELSHTLGQTRAVAALNTDNGKMHVQVRATGNAALERPTRTKGKVSAIEENHLLSN